MSKLAWNPASRGTSVELVGAHIISTSYPRRSKELKETPDATILTTEKIQHDPFLYA